MSSKNVTAILLAAGMSRRMGRPKLDLPWGESTVIGQVASSLAEGGAGAGLGRILVVTGGARRQVERALGQVHLPVPLELVYNPDYARGEMLSSLQVGLGTLQTGIRGVLVCLGDQPQMRSDTVRQVLQAYQAVDQPLVVPSYAMRRGHPWVIDRSLWAQALALQPPHTLRDFLTDHQALIQYVLVDTPTILDDLDTPQDYQRYRSPESNSE